MKLCHRGLILWPYAAHFVPTVDVLSVLLLSLHLMGVTRNFTGAFAISNC